MDERGDGCGDAVKLRVATAILSIFSWTYRATMSVESTDEMKEQISRERRACGLVGTGLQTTSFGTCIHDDQRKFSLWNEGNG